MDAIIDGSYTLKELESTLRLTEAAGYQLTALAKGEETLVVKDGGEQRPINNASFRELPAGERPQPLTLRQHNDAAAPAAGGQQLVLDATVFVEGNSQRVDGFR